MLQQKITIIVVISIFCFLAIAQDTPDERVRDEDAQFQDANLEESPDEAIGDRIMEEMNGMKVLSFLIKCWTYKLIVIFQGKVWHCSKQDWGWNRQRSKRAGWNAVDLKLKIILHMLKWCDNIGTLSFISYPIQIFIPILLSMSHLS